MRSLFSPWLLPTILLPLLAGCAGPMDENSVRPIPTDPGAPLPAPGATEHSSGSSSSNGGADPSSVSGAPTAPSNGGPSSGTLAPATQTPNAGGGISASEEPTNPGKPQPDPWHLEQSGDDSGQGMGITHDPRSTNK